MAEPEALPDPTPAQLAEAARIDAVEGTSEVAGVVEGQTTEGDPTTFPREYVEQLRRENADRRKRAEELEGRNAKLVAGLLRAEVVADGRLADPADLLDAADATALLDDDGAPAPDKVKAAVSDLLVVAVGCASGQRTAQTKSTATTTPTETTEAFPDEGVTTTNKPQVATGKVGETVTLTSNDTGEEVLQLQVSRVKFASGDEYNKPERGLYLGVYVKTKALADDQSSQWGALYVQMRGHHYDAGGCCPEGFEPELDYVDLNEGETAEGWLIFDVPARHGQVVLEQEFGGGKIATWSF